MLLSLNDLTLSLLINLVSIVPIPNKKEVVVSNTDPLLEGCESAFETNWKLPSVLAQWRLDLSSDKTTVVIPNPFSESSFCTLAMILRLNFT